MTTENGASLDAALGEVFSSGRDRGGNSAPPEVEAAPAPAPVAQDAAPPAVEPPKTDPDEQSEANNGRTVPLNELTGERKKYKALLAEEARLRAEADAERKVLREQLDRYMRAPQQAAQPQPQPQQRVQLPDPQQYPFEHLQAVMQLQAEQIQAQRTDDKLNWSEDLARSKYGDDIVAAAQQAAMKWPPADLERLRSLRHPYDELVKWFKSQEALKTIGSDPEAYKKKIYEEAQAKILEDLKAGRLSANGLSGQQPAAAPAPQHFPGTLASATQQGPTGQITKTLEAAVGDVLSSDRKVRGMRR